MDQNSSHYGRSDSLMLELLTSMVICIGYYLAVATDTQSCIGLYMAVIGWAYQSLLALSIATTLRFTTPSRRPGRKQASASSSNIRLLKAKAFAWPGKKEATYLYPKSFWCPHGGWKIPIDLPWDDFNTAIRPMLNLAHLAEMEVKHRCNQVLELGFPLGGLAKLFSQEWEGDVTVVMPATLAQYSKIIQNPSHLELQKAANQGRRCTWEKLSAIKANCGIELALDECVTLLNHIRRLKRSAERAAASHGLASTARFSASKRIPSWNCIARENSTSSLEEYVADVAASFHHGSGHMGGPLGRNFRIHRDGSDSESESADLNSWTRSGGPLMRTTSANKFIQFVQSLEFDAEMNQQWTREDVLQHINVDENEGLAGPSNLVLIQSPGKGPQHNSRSLTHDRSSENADYDLRGVGSSRVPVVSSIMVSEGDLLQTEMIHNGIVLNVVKKEDLTLTDRTSDPDQFHSSSQSPVVECEQLECLGRELEIYNASSASSSDDEGIDASNLFDEKASRCSNDPSVTDG